MIDLRSVSVGLSIFLRFRKDDVCRSLSLALRLINIEWEGQSPTISSRFAYAPNLRNGRFALST